MGLEYTTFVVLHTVTPLTAKTSPRPYLIEIALFFFPFHFSKQFYKKCFVKEAEKTMVRVRYRNLECAGKKSRKKLLSERIKVIDEWCTA
ncbi:unnamed protein product [Gongylonema pulchrum]|uniref:Secreted protein n=1 Tax=Gongylonema pulchrum TaxID=637853 RepID=A0A183D0J2_9BILA|nr:unnamed protein product [Gongylonema pulchrum]